MLQLPFLAGYASTYGSLADPQGGSAIVAAINWLQGTLLGTVATTHRGDRDRLGRADADDGPGQRPLRLYRLSRLLHPVRRGPDLGRDQGRGGGRPGGLRPAAAPAGLRRRPRRRPGRSMPIPMPGRRCRRARGARCRRCPRTGWGAKGDWRGRERVARAMRWGPRSSSFPSVIATKCRGSPRAPAGSRSPRAGRTMPRRASSPRARRWRWSTRAARWPRARRRCARSATRPRPMPRRCWCCSRAATAAALERFLAHGATHFLVSPFTEPQFLHALQFARRHAERVGGGTRRRDGEDREFAVLALAARLAHRRA